MDVNAVTASPNATDGSSPYEGALLEDSSSPRSMLKSRSKSFDSADDMTLGGRDADKEGEPKRWSRKGAEGKPFFLVSLAPLS